MHKSCSDSATGIQFQANVCDAKGDQNTNTQKHKHIDNQLRSVNNMQYLRNT